MKELDFAVELIKEIKEKYLNGSEISNKKIMDKGYMDVVTNLDREIEQYTVKRINEEFPQDNILGEEFGGEIKGRAWIIDPIDGTCNFACDSPIYGFQMAFAIDGDAKMSVIYLPAYDELYHAVKGEGAFVNGKQYKIADNDIKIEHALINTGDTPKKNPEWFDAQTEAVLKLNKKALRVRCFGAACHEFVYLSKNNLQAYILYCQNAWDILPGYLLAMEAGAVFVNGSGEPYKFGDVPMIGAVNYELGKTIAEIIAQRS
jgi:myo-inositol-1(or 4)-monophosphatase